MPLRLPSLGLALCLLAPAAFAQSGGLTPLDVARIQTVGNVVVSPDGDHVAYTVSNPRDPFEANARPYTELHVYNVERGESTGLRGGAVTHSRVAWTPDGRLSFLTKAADGDARPSLYVMDPATGELERALQFGTSIGVHAWSPDGQRVAFVASEPEPEREAVLPYEPEVYEESVVDKKLWIATPFSDAAPRLVEDLAGTVYDLGWSPDGARIAVAVAPNALVDESYMDKRIRILDAETGATLTRIENPGKLGKFAWSPSGNHLAFISAEDRGDPKEGRLMVADARTGEVADALPDYPGHITHMVWSDDDTLVYSADRGVETVIERVARTGGEPETVVPAETAVFTGFSHADGVIALAGESPRHPAELFVMTDGLPERVTTTNPWLADRRLAKQEVIRHEARDGLELEGILIHPLDRAEGARVPVIMTVHGGPEAHERNGWRTNYSRLGQMAAARGYAVFYPNYRGSTGRGVAFSKTSQGDPAGKEFDDVVDAVDHLIEIGLADPDKVGVTGGSYGGYATGWLTTRYSDRFAAGVMFVGISNKISKVGTTDIPNEEFYVHALKRPWDDWQFFLERSPIYYADRSDTPLLIMHGADDPRVHPSQSLELYRYLKLRGKAPVRLVYYPGEGHGNRSATARFDYTLRALRWFDHYLMGPGGEPPAYGVEALAEQERASAMPAGTN